MQPAPTDDDRQQGWWAVHRFRYSLSNEPFRIGVPAGNRNQAVSFAALGYSREDLGGAADLPLWTRLSVPPLNLGSHSGFGSLARRRQLPGGVGAFADSPNVHAEAADVDGDAIGNEAL